MITIFPRAMWCGICRQFTSNLKQTYNTLKEKKRNFEIIFVSMDENIEAFTDYFDNMPWKAVPFESNEIRTKAVDKFVIENIPQLIFINNDGTIKNECGYY